MAWGDPVQSAAADANPASADYPDTPIEGNLLVAIAMERSGGSAADYTISGTGWESRISRTTLQSDANARGTLKVWTKIAGASEPTNVSIDNGTANSIRVLIIEYDADGNTLEFLAQNSNDSGTSGSSPLSTGTTSSVTGTDFISVAVCRWRTGTAFSEYFNTVAFTNSFGDIQYSYNTSQNSRAIVAADKVDTTESTYESTVSWTEPFNDAESAAGILVFGVVTADVGITFDAAANSGTQVAQSTYTFARTITGTNTFLAVDVPILSVGQTVTSIVDNYDVAPVSLVKIGSQATVTSLGLVECWGLAGAVTGTKNIQVTLSGSVTSVAVAASYTGVHQSYPTEAFNSAQATNAGSAADATVNITTVADNCWVHGAVIVNDDAITAGQTSRNNVSFAAVGSGANEDNNAAKTPPGSVTMSYTGVADLKTWAIAGYAIRPVAASGLSKLLALLGVGS